MQQDTYNIIKQYLQFRSLRTELSVHLLNKIISRPERNSSFSLLYWISSGCGNPVRILYKKPYATCTKNLNTTVLQCLLWKIFWCENILIVIIIILFEILFKMKFFVQMYVIPWLLWLGVVNKWIYIVNYSTEKNDISLILKV